MKENEPGWSINIERTETGYILETPEPNEELGKRWVRGGGDDEVLEYTVDMLYDILNYFALSGSKHDPRRIRIEIEEKP